jgi:hypothetical protein
LTDPENNQVAGIASAHLSRTGTAIYVDSIVIVGCIVSAPALSRRLHIMRERVNVDIVQFWDADLCIPAGYNPYQ